MKTVLNHIMGCKRDYAELPFFEFLRDEGLKARDRLAFLAGRAPLITRFGDMNRQVLESLADEYLRLLDEHSHADEDHWPRHLDELIKLGCARPARISEPLRFVFNDKAAHNRWLAHRLAPSIWSAIPVVRLAIVEAIDETGKVLCALTTQLAAELERECGIKLRREFQFHLKAGSEMDADRRKLMQIGLDAATRRSAIERVDCVFDTFREWTDDLLALAQGTLRCDASHWPPLRSAA